MKKCSKCRQDKAFVLFSKDKAITDGHKSWCKACCAKYRSDNKKALAEYNTTWRENNRAKYNSMLCNWRKANKHVDRAAKGRRRATKLSATPKWLTQEQITEILNIYKNCPKGHEVDHIVPLQGKTVTGLHVPWNLQYLLASDNRSKSNRL